MKYFINKLICTLLFLISFVTILTACGDVECKVDFIIDDEIYATVNTRGNETIKMPTDPQKDGYIFNGWYWDKDVWQKPFTANSLLDAPLSSDMKVYAKFSLQETLGENFCKFKTLTVNTDNTVYGKVPNGTVAFSFLNEIETNGTATYSIYLDMICSQEVKSKTVPLVTGDNTFYVWAEGTDKGDILYTVTVRVKPLYDVTFDTLGGTNIDLQTVEEDALAIIPKEPTKIGYTFVSWDFDFATSIKSNTVITAFWIANDYTVTFNKNGGSGGTNKVTATYDSEMPYADAPNKEGYIFDGYYDKDNNKYYDASMASVKTWNKDENVTLYARWVAKSNITYTVNHYKQNIENDKYMLFETDYLTGIADASITPNVKIYAGFSSPLAQTVNISPDGTLVVDYYYTRNSYTLMIVGNGGLSKTITQKYGSRIDTAQLTTTRDGYELGGLYTDVDLTTIYELDTTMPAENKNVYAYWIGENKPIDFKYSFDENNATITDYNGNSAVVKIPIQIGGKNVVSIGEFAFSNCMQLQSIVIPDGIIDIQRGAFFECTALENVSLPNSVTKISEDIFRACSSLKSILIPNNVLSIDIFAFLGCTKLTSITIPRSVQNIHPNAFIECAGLTSITVESGNTVYHSNGNCLIETKSKTLILGCKNSVIPSDNSVKSIGNSAFRGCTELTSITIPANITSIDRGVFSLCINLVRISFAAESTWYYTKDSVEWDNKTGGTEVDLTNPATNAIYFRNTYSLYYWYKK